MLFACLYVMQLPLVVDSMFLEWKYVLYLVGKTLNSTKSVVVVVYKVINIRSYNVLLHSAVTSRPPRPGEVNGEQYTFVTRAEMEKDILNKR